MKFRVIQRLINCLEFSITAKKRRQNFMNQIAVKVDQKAQYLQSSAITKLRHRFSCLITEVAVNAAKSRRTRGHDNDSVVRLSAVFQSPSFSQVFSQHCTSALQREPATQALILSTILQISPPRQLFRLPSPVIFLRAAQQTSLDASM